MKKRRVIYTAGGNYIIGGDNIREEISQAAEQMRKKLKSEDRDPFYRVFLNGKEIENPTLMPKKIHHKDTIIILPLYVEDL